MLELIYAAMFVGLVYAVATTIKKFLRALR
jgi:hypothetical protein